MSNDPVTVRTHELKTDPAVFAAVAAGLKTHEIRLNDRGFAVGDRLVLRETAHDGQHMRLYPTSYPLEYTGRVTERTISHIQTGYGLAEGWCILSFAAQPEAKAEQARDNCQFCLGAKGGVRGNENVIAGITACDYCSHLLTDHFPASWPSQSAPIEAGELPPLPKAERELIELHQPSEYTTHVCTSARYTADQMLAYGKLCRDIKLDDGDSIYRVHVEGWATKAGWVNKAEGAFEFAQRTCYRQGWNDAVTQLNMKEGQQ